MREKLSEYGYSFQCKLIATLFKDRAFLQQIIDILEPTHFESEANIAIVEMIREYFYTYKQAPTIEVMSIKVKEITNDVLRTTIITHLKDSYKQLDAPDLEFVKEQTIKFCKNQLLKAAIMDSVELLKRGEFDQIKLKIDEAMKAGLERSIGHDYKDEIDARYLESVRNTVTTGWPVIDDIADGGLGKGELGVMVAPSGIGKSWALVNVGAAAIKAGLNVIHYTLELNEAYVGLRYDAVMSGIQAQELKYHIEEVKTIVGKLPGKLIVKYYPTKGATVNSLASHLEKCRMQGFEPDLIICDYADLLRGHGKEVRHELGNIYEDLRGLAGEHEIPVWTASQANRSSLSDDIIGAENISK